MALPGSDGGVVTASPMTSGARLSAGAVVLQRDGKPLFAMPGAFPFYRDLTLGDSGPDVSQLQAGLMDAGFLDGSDGKFGRATAEAVTSLYRSAGAEPPKTTSDTDASTPPDPTAADGSSSADDATAEGASSDSGRQKESGAAKQQVSVSMNDLLVVGAMPCWLVKAPAVGTVTSASDVVTIERGDLQAVAAVSGDVAATYPVGSEGSVRAGGKVTEVKVADSRPQAPSTGEQSSEDGGSAAAGASTDGGSTNDQQQSNGRTLSFTGAFPESLRGQSVTVSVDVQVAARDSLIVPTAAVIPGGSGTAHVLVKHDDGFERVAVDEIAELDGKSAVKPSSANALRAGDQVRVK